MTATMEIENMATSGVDPLAIPSKHRKTYLRENSGWEKMHAMSSHGQNVNYSGRSCGFYENISNFHKLNRTATKMAATHLRGITNTFRVQ